jgi:hypothetical protein
VNDPDPFDVSHYPDPVFDRASHDELHGAFWWERVLIIGGSFLALGVVVWLIGALTG